VTLRTFGGYQRTDTRRLYLKMVGNPAILRDAKPFLREKTVEN